MKLDQSIYDNVETEDIDKSVLKVGCLFACLLEKKGMVIFKCYVKKIIIIKITY